MKFDPISGPIPRNEFRKLVDAPYGVAADAIAKYAAPEGAEIEWLVKFTKRATVTGYARVKASSLKEATELAEGLRGREIGWEPDHNCDDAGELVSVEPETDDF